MDEEEVSSQVKQFIAACIPSLARLEILLLLKTTMQQWSAEAISREFRIDSRAAEEQLKALMQDGFLQCAEANLYQYAPSSADLDGKVIALAQAYLVRRVTVISVIFSGPNDALRSFSDSFKIRKDSSNG